MEESRIDLYNRAKQAYYTGEPIMSDTEFDELECELGLNNSAYIGTHHSDAYTIRHPFIMGSLSKVQVKNIDNHIDWDAYTSQAQHFFCRNSTGDVIVTPKYDGCSFECILDHTGILSISTRGDGYYGKDISMHLRRHIPQDVIEKASQQDGTTVVRGEVLIGRSVYNERYADTFVNPRSMVAGVLNSKYISDDETLQAQLDDLSIVIYDVRLIDADSTVRDIDWNKFFASESFTPQFYEITHIDAADDFKRLYDVFSAYRDECDYALDGFVIKPVDDYREMNTVEERPRDCVAIKFMPMMSSTVVERIEWGLSKTYEYTPVIIVRPIMLDGKRITRVSAHNYGYIIDNSLFAGAQVTISLAGDIIPFIYSVDKKGSRIPGWLPDGPTTADGCHLYAVLSEVEQRRLRFLSSADVLSIQNIGPAAAARIYDYMNTADDIADDFLDLTPREPITHIMQVTDKDITNALGGRSGDRAARSFSQRMSSLTLADIIESCVIPQCGAAASQACADYILTGSADFTGLSSKAYEWVITGGEHLDYVNKLLFDTGRPLESFATEHNETAESAIPVILTGEPSTASSKSDFISAHPEYRVTTKWSECKILFTNSLESKTSKMKKAMDKGIEIREY